MGAILPAVTLVLRESDVERVIQMDPVIAAVESAMRELGGGIAQNEPRQRAFPPGGMLNVMFASYPGGGCTGLKVYTVAAGRVRHGVPAVGGGHARRGLRGIELGDRARASVRRRP